MTAVELITLIGREGRLSVGGMSVAVIVQDARITYGKVHVLIAPQMGEGQKWVDEQSVRFVK